MNSIRIASPLAIGLLLALAGCSQSQDAAKANAAAAAQVAPTSGAQAMRQLRPLTDMEIAKDAYAKLDFPKALDHFRAAATAGDADAQYYTGVMYAEAQGTKKNIAEAVRWYEKAAARDQPDALYALARLYLVGYGVDHDLNKSIEYFDKALAKYPPGEARDRAEQQRLKLAAVLEEQRATAEAAKTPPPPPRQ
jgi:TPR repeat protein